MLDAGTVELSANKGRLILESGSLIDVSGARGEIDQFRTSGVQTLAIAGAGGSISLHALEGLAANGELQGKAAAVAGAAGGTLSIGLDLYDRSQNPNASISGAAIPFPTNDRILTLTSGPANALPGSPANGTASISAGQLQAGGFDQIELKSTDVIAIDGNVDLGAVDAAWFWTRQYWRGNATASANLHAAYVALGNVNGTNQPGGGETLPQRDPCWGCSPPGQGEAAGYSRQQHTRQIFTARYQSEGDIRFSYSVAQSTTNFTGSLKSPGNLTFQANQLYPVTRADFTLNPVGTIHREQ